jgi:hypothetical protein
VKEAVEDLPSAESSERQSRKGEGAPSGGYGLVPESAAVPEVMVVSGKCQPQPDPKPASNRLDGRVKSFIGLKGFSLPRIRSNFRYDAYANARYAAL